MSATTGTPRKSMSVPQAVACCQNPCRKKSFNGMVLKLTMISATSPTNKANVMMLRMNRKNTLKSTPIACPIPLPADFTSGAACEWIACALSLTLSLTSPPHSSALAPSLSLRMSDLLFTPCRSSLTLCLMLSRSTFSPRISNFSEAVCAMGTTIQSIM